MHQVKLLLSSARTLELAPTTVGFLSTSSWSSLKLWLIAAVHSWGVRPSTSIGVCQRVIMSDLILSVGLWTPITPEMDDAEFEMQVDSLVGELKYHNVQLLSAELQQPSPVPMSHPHSKQLPPLPQRE